MSLVQESPELWRALRGASELIELVTHARESDLKLQQDLRKQYPAELVLAALQLRDSRRRAIGKFSRAQTMWFNRIGVEQCTAESVAQHKARRFQGCSTVWDLCCGIGSDAIAIASAGPHVTAVDLTPIACLRTAWNAEEYGVAERISTQVGNVTELSLTDAHVHIDPDRRAGISRAMRIEDYEPPLSYLEQLTTTARGGAIKLSPASNFGGKFPDCEVELISLDGECKEATIWFGDRRTETPWRATLLPSGATLTGDPFLARGPVGPLGQFLYDPDPAVVRAGLIDILAETGGFHRLDAAEEYLTSATRIASPFVRTFEVLDELPHNQKELSRAIAARSIGELEIKCRHVPVDVNALRRKLKLTGTERLVLFIARLQGKTRYVIARRLDTSH